MTDSIKLELDAHYYLKLNNGKTEVQKFIGGFVLRNDDEIAEVLGKVPSYDEYQTLLSDQLAKNEGEEINAELQAENKQLKELLKECNLAIFDYPPYDLASCKIWLQNKIKEVLKW